MSNNEQQTDEADRLAYFAAVQEGFRRAESAAGGTLDRFYSVGGATVCFKFAGPALLDQLDPALAHLRAEPTAQPALTVCLWDSVSTGAPLPLLLRSLVQLLRLRWWEQLNGRREIKGYNSPRLRTTFHLGPDILSVLDSATNLACYWVDDAAQIPYYERSHPLQHILNSWAETRGLYFMHAAAVGTSNGGVLLAGPGGSGKSTTTLACLDSDLGIAGDDYTLVANDPAPYAYSLYNTVKLTALDKFPQLAPFVANGAALQDEKPMIFLAEHYPQKMLRGYPIRAVLLPHIRGGTATWLQPAPAAAALKALAPSTLLQLSGTGQGAFRAMARLVRQAPCYTLELGTDLTQIPAVITRLLGELA